MKWDLTRDTGMTGKSTIIPNDKETNSWRALLFDAILKDVMNPSSAGKEGRYSSLFKSNIQAVAAELVDTLQGVCSHSLDPYIYQVDVITRDLGVLALQMGSQRAHILLETCTHGQRLRGNDKFTDETHSLDSDASVDLMTQPCLIRLGDGCEDLTSMKVLVKGNFMPLKATR